MGSKAGAYKRRRCQFWKLQLPRSSQNSFQNPPIAPLSIAGTYLCCVLDSFSRLLLLSAFLFGVQLAAADDTFLQPSEARRDMNFSFLDMQWVVRCLHFAKKQKREMLLFWFFFALVWGGSWRWTRPTSGGIHCKRWPFTWSVSPRFTAQLRHGWTGRQLDLVVNCATRPDLCQVNGLTNAIQLNAIVQVFCWRQDCKCDWSVVGSERFFLHGCLKWILQPKEFATRSSKCDWRLVSSGQCWFPRIHDWSALHNEKFSLFNVCFRSFSCLPWKMAMKCSHGNVVFNVLCLPITVTHVWHAILFLNKIVFIHNGF